jgi:hypothetical protein
MKRSMLWTREGSGATRRNRIRFAVAALAVGLLAALSPSCDNPTESKNTKGVIEGELLESGTGLAIRRPGWVFSGNRLLASADSTGAFEIPSLDPGEYTLTGAALGHRDTVFTVIVSKGRTTRMDFPLNPENTEGRVIGEFQNTVLYRDSLAAHPEMAGWDAKEIYDASTGATIQGKEPLLDFNERQVFAGDTLVDVSDNWGQYGFRMKGGTVPFRGSCAGYKDSLVVAKLIPAGKLVVNFFLEPQTLAR